MLRCEERIAKEKPASDFLRSNAVHPDWGFKESGVGEGQGVRYCALNRDSRALTSILRTDVRFSEVRFPKDVPMANLIQAGVSVFGLFTIDPALLAFIMIFGVFATLNYIDKKRID